MLGTRLALVALCVSVITCALWARKPGDPLKPGFNLFSRQQDIQIGQASAAQVKRRYQEVPNPFLQNYIQRIGSRLAETPEARQGGFPFNFTMLNVPLVNAFALPGGPMFIFTGLIKATENEAQLAGVMAHEMSHVILRHGTHEASKAKATGIGAMLAGAVAGAAMGNTSAAAQLSHLGLGLGENSLILHFSRAAESEADLLGSHLMAEAGYNPIEMANFFEKLATTTSAGSQFFSDHPNPDNRERAIETEIRGLPQREYGYETGDFARVKAEVAALPVSGRGGAVTAPLPAGVAPAGGWQETQLDTFRIAYPSNWTGYKGSKPSQFLVAPAGGIVRLPNGLDLVLGVRCDYFHPDNPQMSLGTATLNLVTHLHATTPSINLASGEQKRVVVDGSEGLVSPLQSRSSAGVPEFNLLLTVRRPEGVFYTLAVAPQANYPQLQGVFSQILNSIRFGAPTSGTPENRQNK